MIGKTKKIIQHENFSTIKQDSILLLLEEFNKCSHPNKINMTIGIYYDEKGQCKLLKTVKKAELSIFKKEHEKSYKGLSGCKEFCKLVEKIYYFDIFEKNKKYIRTINTTGGSAALRIIFEFIKKNYPRARYWLGIPAWNNYKSILDAVGCEALLFDYEPNDIQINFLEHLNHQLRNVQPGDVILLQGPCHNPTGRDPTLEKWEMTFNYLMEKKVLPIFDCAYIGLSQGLQEDINFLKLACNFFDTFFVCTSFSKIFTIYNERAGAVSIISKNKKYTDQIGNNICSISSGLYFMPPNHGAAIVSTILASNELFSQLQNELQIIRERLAHVRQYLDATLGVLLNNNNNFIDSKGLFNLLPLSKNQILKLKKQTGLFIDNSGRTNISSININNVDYFCHAIKSVIEK